MNKSDIYFQAFNWGACDEIIENYDDKTAPSSFKYVIKCFGRTTDNKSIYVKIENYQPFFFIRMPIGSNPQRIMDLIKRGVYYKYSQGFKKFLVTEKCSFDEFTNYSKFRFMKIFFDSLYAYKGFKWYIQEKTNYELYECDGPNVPLLRFAHLRKIEMSGIIKLNKNDLKIMKFEESHDEINLQIEWNKVNPCSDEEILNLPSIKFTVASFDLETISGDENFPQADRITDKIVSIGTTFHKTGETECYYRSIITLGSCKKINGVDLVTTCDTEGELLLKWRDLIVKMNPDVLTGYNIFLFDIPYLNTRAKKMGVYDEFMKIGKLKNKRVFYKDDMIESKAMGPNKMCYYDEIYRTQIDMMKIIQTDYKLPSYKLDDVSSDFIREKIIKVENNDGKTKIYSKETFGMKSGKFVKLLYFDGILDRAYNDDSSKKYKVTSVNDGSIEIDEKLDAEKMNHLINEKKIDHIWCQAKDDFDAKDTTEYYQKDIEHRTILAKYCVQDCELANQLMIKLQTIGKLQGMSNVCSVPLSFNIHRGLGIRIYSLQLRFCKEYDHLIPLAKKNKTDFKVAPKVTPKASPKKKSNGLIRTQFEEDENLEKPELVNNPVNELCTYEGAIVLEPEKGIYHVPIPVLDFESLYPMSMCEMRLSPDRLVKNLKYMNLPGYRYEKVYTNVEKNEYHVFAIEKDPSQGPGIVPNMLEYLLTKRRSKKKLMSKEKDPFKRSILDGLQLAYKVVANSVYGQFGASVSSVPCREVAASTTAVGRDRLLMAKKFVEKVFPKLVKPVLKGDYEKFKKRINILFKKQTCCEVEMFVGTNVSDSKFVNYNECVNDINDFSKYAYDKLTDYLDGLTFCPKCIYGDTDSIFVDFRMRSKITNKIVKNKHILDMAIKLGMMCSEIINIILPSPHNLEYEKTFYPFIILQKKKYVGNKYDFTPDKCNLVYMGIELKRRDNSPIVKLFLAGMLDQIINKKSNKGAIDYVIDMIKKMMNNQFPIEFFIITKKYKGNYKSEPAHVTLAKRIENRDPGSAYKLNDRIKFVYIVNTKAKKGCKQGDIIEDPRYIIENKLKIDYGFYLEKQIMKPCCRFLGYVTSKDEDPEEKLFGHYIRMNNMIKNGKRPITSYDMFNNENVKNECNPFN